ncbi:MAG: cobyrinate a,c-diamide synthase [Deltaproteobacteria bacterium]|nr:cobyrinate a,c-diamide synthase [Deltaproteobacteria bacterium]
MVESHRIPRLVIAGTASGVGKTTVVVGLTRALQARGLSVAVFKCGPDYLDPTYHARAAGRPCQNLDGWMMGRDAVLATFARAARDADIALIEGVMGLFDGASPTGESGSAAEIAKWLGAPVLLVVDASGMARSIAAVAGGFAAFDDDLQVAGVICNRVGSRGHLELLRKALAKPPIVGGLPDESALRFPERHLGLVHADERSVPETVLAEWGVRVAEWMDLDTILAIARCTAPLSAESLQEASPAATRCRIGLAFDEAFHFYYEDNLRRLEQLGAELVRFSPVHDASLPQVDGLYLGGGYPEAHAEALSRNRSMHEAVRSFAAAGGPIYAECGGLMYLTAAIRTLDDRLHPMVGLIPGQVVMRDRLQALGYVEVETQMPSLLGPAGLRFRGHEFRYSELHPSSGDLDCLYSVRRRRSDRPFREGYRLGSVLASYVHAHWASNPLAAEGFVESCARYAGRGR